MRLTAGQRIDPFEVTTLPTGTLRVPGRGLTHLQFRRFAGCPICNMHLRTYSKRVDELRASGITSVVFFASTVELLAPYRSQMPFQVVSDPERVWYQRFEVERSRFAALNPSAITQALLGVSTRGANLVSGAGPADGLPADFLIEADGLVRAAKYGRHANDQWTVDDVLGFGQLAAKGSPRLAH